MTHRSGRGNQRVWARLEEERRGNEQHERDGCTGNRRALDLGELAHEVESPQRDHHVTEHRDQERGDQRGQRETRE